MSGKRDVILAEVRSRLGRGDLTGGGRSLRKLLRLRPGDAEGLYLLGMLRLQEGSASDAATLMRRAMDSGLLTDAVVLENIGTAYLMSGDAAAAESLLQRAVAAGGQGALLQMRLGMALAALGRWEEAEARLLVAQKMEPFDADILVNLGNVLAARGSTDAALRQYGRVLEISPGHVQALYNTGTLHRDAGRLEDAIEAYGAVLACDPKHAETLINLGALRERLGETTEAERLYREALVAGSDDAVVYSNLASVLRAQRRLEEAEQCGERALALRPDFADALVNLAGIHAEQGRIELARGEYFRAWLMVPEDDEAHLWYGTLGLALGKFAESWTHYRIRATRGVALKAAGGLDDKLPDDVRGLTILLVGEQGIGDELFFLRYAERLKTRGAQLLCLCDTKIRTLLEGVGLFDRLFCHGEPLPPSDLRFAVGDLPLVLGSHLDATLPAPLRLRPQPDREESMRCYLAQAGPPPHVAVTWRSGTRLSEQMGWSHQVLSKEVPLDALAAALKDIPGSIVSLQRNPDVRETERLQQMLGRPVFDASEINSNLENMLALLGLLHEYVGVSNTNMHLLAGLGRGARVVVPNPPEWRWMAAGSVSPWFPQFTVYRESPGGTWQEAMAELRADLLRNLECVPDARHGGY